MDEECKEGDHPFPQPSDQAQQSNALSGELPQAEAK